MTRFPVITAVANAMAHAPSLVRYGSKPTRDSARDPSAIDRLVAHLRPYEAALGYAPNQSYIGNFEPEYLATLSRPWFANIDGSAARQGAFGDLIDEIELLGLLKVCDRARLIQLDEVTLSEARARLLKYGYACEGDFERVAPARPEDIVSAIERGEALPLMLDGRVVGAAGRGHEEDEALTANVLLENLVCKATAVLALRQLLEQVSDRLGPEDIGFVISGSEEAVGDRYQRGGGGLGKAVAESAGLVRATAIDLKAFCASTLYAVINAAALVHAGLFSRVVVVAGGSLAKLGMKYRAHVTKGMPVLEDVLAGIAILVEPADRPGPAVRLDTLGLHTIGAGSSQQAIIEALVMHPLDKGGYRLTDVDRYATEMHNPEVTEPAGSGNVPENNYRVIAALAALHGHIPLAGQQDFVAKHGMPGYAPTQGHIASAVCYLAHALRAMREGRMCRVLFMAKGSLFLGRMTELADGVSFLLEA